MAVPGDEEPSSSEEEELATLLGLHWLDFTVIGLYFALVLGVTLLICIKNGCETVPGYFLAGRSMHWIIIGTSIFASNIGAGHCIGLAGSGAVSGITVGHFEQSAVIILMILGWFFVPVYLNADVYTFPQYMKKRYGGERIRLALSVVSLMVYVFTKVVMELNAFRIFMQRMTNGNDTCVDVMIILLLLLTAVITTVGGLKAGMWTDSVQALLMISGAAALMGFSLYEVGGLAQLEEKFPYSVASKTAVDVAGSRAPCGRPPESYMMFFSDNNYPWVGMVFGLTINSIWYWCSDQVMIQRILSSKSILHAKGGCITAACLKFLPLWLFVIPGMAARVLYKERVTCATPDSCQAVCGNQAGCSNIAYPELVLHLMPQGARGMMIVVVMAGMVSTLTSVANSISSLFTMDVSMWVRQKLSKTNELSDRQLLVIGRAFAIVSVIIASAWIPIMHYYDNPKIFEDMQRMSSCLVPPIGAIALLALFWERSTEKGVFWGLMVGFALGITRMVLEFLYEVGPCGTDTPDLRPEVIRYLMDRIDFMQFASLLWLTTSIVVAFVSLLTKPVAPDRLYKLTFRSRKEAWFRSPSLEQFQIEPEPSDGNVSWWRRIAYNICRSSEDVHFDDVSTVSVPERVSNSEQNTNQAERLKGSRFWTNFLNVAATACVVLTYVTYSYFS